MIKNLKTHKMETKKYSRRTTWNMKRNYGLYSATQSLCLHSSKGIFGSSRRYC